MFDLQSHHLSSGSFGAVYNTLIPNVVMKTADDDPVWTYWAAFCLQYCDYSPYLPRVYSLICDPYGGKSSALMERLTNREHDYWIQAHDELRMLRMLNEVDPRLGQTFKAFLGHLKEDAKLSDDFRLDAHCGNWMFRGDQVVLTDPVAGRVFYDATKSPLFDHEGIKIHHA